MAAASGFAPSVSAALGEAFSLSEMGSFLPLFVPEVPITEFTRGLGILKERLDVCRVVRLEYKGCVLGVVRVWLLGVLLRWLEIMPAKDSVCELELSSP